ncbi:MAG TPA: hypothetical protein VK144_06695 [Bacillota bacterium]|nr:hypothetical protein [Bacillota bacterium]
MGRQGITFWVMISVIGLCCTACFSKGNEFRPDQVIENALKSDEEVSYYAESETIIKENDEDYTSSTSKEWFSRDGRGRMETVYDDGSGLIITSNIKKIQIYDTESNELLEGNFSEFEEFTNSPKEEMMILIEGIQDTHNIEYIGEEKLLGRKTHHIQATPRDNTSLNGEQEHWFDAEYSIILKSRFTFGDTMSEIVYTHFEPNKELEDSLFTIESTEDMTVIDLDEINPETAISFEELQQLTKEEMAYFPENEEIEIESILLFEMEDMPDSYTINYINNGLPFASLEINESPSDWALYDAEDFEEIQSRVHDIYFQTIFEQDVYMWEHDGIHYQIWMNDPSVSQDEVLRLIDGMEMVNDT